MMKLLPTAIAALLCAMLSMAVQAQSAPARTLPALTVRDSAGATVSLSDLHIEQRWVLAVIDPALPSAAAMLRDLAAKDTTWTERLTVLLLRESEGVRAAIAAEPKFGAMRVIVASNVNAATLLDLPGVPSLVGIRENREIAWTRAGLPAQPARLHRHLSSWLGLAGSQ